MYLLENQKTEQVLMSFVSLIKFIIFNHLVKAIVGAYDPDRFSRLQKREILTIFPTDKTHLR